MKPFDPLSDVENGHLVLDEGQWPSFHDAEVHDLRVWRGDIRPEDNVWTGPVIEAAFELCALRDPFIAELRFHDCDGISLQGFNHQNAVYDLSFQYVERGEYNDGSPLPPAIAVRFEQVFGAALSFTCMRVEALGRGGTSVTRLHDLLLTLSPRLLPGDYVFCTIAAGELAAFVDLSPLGSFREPEGLTLLLARDAADGAGLEYSGLFRCITLGVNSALDDVGLTAAVAGRLARSGISANVVAAYHHDHVFVPAQRAEEALALLQQGLIPA